MLSAIRSMILFPLVDDVVAQENLREARPVGLHLRVAAVTFDRRGAAEDHCPLTRLQHCRTCFRLARIERERRPRHTRLGERGEDAIGRPGLLRSRLQDQPQLKRNRRQPQRMHARRIRRQHGRQHRRLRLVADRDAASFFAIPAAQDVEIESPRQAAENLLHVLEHERILGHVRPAHMLGQPRARRLLMDEIVGRLRAVAHRQRAVLIQIGRFAKHGNQLATWNCPQRIAGLLRCAHVPLDNPAAGLADGRDRLARRKMRDFGHLQRIVRLAPTDNR